ncbi:MAG: glycoside hydrolase family 43 protein [Lachnospiraceae bacterium]|nr:glycoside hydrolase family 43 protein [Lachnospiraceae bacterium]
MKVKNPVIPGFHPDPSLLCVGKDYYIATSTFEWFPGVCILHSTDLANWEIASYALTDDQKVDMTGLDMSCGIWAPNLTWNEGKFYLTYTIVYTDRQRYKDTYNFVTTAPDVCGPWSDPVLLNASGFDPSMFHENGRHYLVNMVIDHRTDKVRFCGIDVQEYDEEKGRLIGNPVRVSKGTGRGETEGPNIFYHEGYYYLVVAEGGTRYQHCTCVLRAKNLFGPYEPDPNNPVLTSAGQEDCLLQRAGHSQAVRGADGNWYMAHLCSRPIEKNSILGRETAIQNITWTKDGWFKLSANDTGKPEAFFEVPDFSGKQGQDHSQKVDFSGETDFSGIRGKESRERYHPDPVPLPLEYMTLRRSFLRNGITIRKGKLHLEGGASVMSKYFQSLVARRQQSLYCDFETCMEFAPRHLNHIAGMLVYYNYDNHYYLKMSRDEYGKFLAVTSNVNKEVEDLITINLPEEIRKVYLKAQIRADKLQYFYGTEPGEWIPIGPVLDMKNISDEHIVGNGFTGSMLGVNCCDCQLDGVFADFEYLNYTEYEG